MAPSSLLLWRGILIPVQSTTKLSSKPTTLDGVLTQKKPYVSLACLVSGVVWSFHQWWCYCRHWKTRTDTKYIVCGRKTLRWITRLPSTVRAVFKGGSQSISLLTTGECKDVLLSFETKWYKVLKIVNFALRVYLRAPYEFRHNQWLLSYKGIGRLAL
jgi:hypothetical protein